MSATLLKITVFAWLLQFYIVRQQSLTQCIFYAWPPEVGSQQAPLTGSHTALYQLFISYLAEEHSTHSSMSSSRLKSTFSNGSKEDEKRVLWRCCPLRNTRKCNQQWPMLDSSNPREFVNIPILAQGRYARNSGTSTWQQQMNYEIPDVCQLLSQIANNQPL